LEALKSASSHNKLKTKEIEELVDQVMDATNEAFALSPKLLDLSRTELNDIENYYFYINRLILDCQKTAHSVSPTVWEELKDRMLRVP